MKDRGAKRRILDAAESLFADQGFHATSLRDITTAARVNLAAVHYYFGSKEALLDAVLERRLGPINRERLQMLKSAQTVTGKDLDVATILRAYLHPPFRMVSLLGQQGAKFMQLMGRLHSETHSDLRHRFIRHFESVLDAFTLAFRQALPGLSADEVHRRLHFVIGAMAHTLVWESGQQGEAGSLEDVFEKLMGFCEAGMRAVPEEQLRMKMKVGA